MAPKDMKVSLKLYTLLNFKSMEGSMVDFELLS